MFTQYFGLKFNPFTKEIEIKDVYDTEDIQELSSRLKYIQKNRGIFLLVGEPGMGKSTALRKFANELNPGLYKYCYFSLLTVTVMDFYRGLLIGLGETPSCRKISMFQQIQHALCNLYHEQKITPVIILDEIQFVSSGILEDLRMLFNFKMDSENPFILILSGQSGIKNKLNLAVNAPLKQRIGIRYTMKGLSKEEISKYIENRLKIAGVSENVFSPQSIETIYSISKGAPRIINNLAISSLMYACAKKQNTIDEEAVYQGHKDFDM